jgi:DNA-binding MarR family transcriptional regulator
MLAFMQATAAAAKSSQDQVAESLYAVLHHLMRSSGREVFQAMADADLTLTTYKALHALDQRELGDDVCVKHVAEDLVMSVPAASRIVEGLHQRGYVERREDEEDRRMKRVAITPAGREVMARVNATRLAAGRQFAATLTGAESKRLAAALAPLLERPEVAACLPDRSSS